MQAFSLVRPTNLNAALAAAAEPDTRFIAGGTDMMQLLKDDLIRPTRIVDLDGMLPDAITADANGLRIGAYARMSEAAEHPVIARDYPVIAQALLASAAPQLRNMATMAGNLLQHTRCGYFRDTGFACNKRVPGSGCPAIAGENRMLAILGTSEHCIATHASDLAVALVALDASLSLKAPDGTERTLGLTEFHALPGDTPHIETVLRPGEAITEIIVRPAAFARRSHYLKVRDRASFEWAVVSVAVALELDGDTVRDARVALGGVGTKPWRAPAAEAALRGSRADDAVFHEAAAASVQGAQPRGQNAFKVTLAQRAVVRALRTAVG